MTASAYLLDTGDLIWTHSDPTKGREQAGRRPVPLWFPQPRSREPSDSLPDRIACAAAPDPAWFCLSSLPIASEIAPLIRAKLNTSSRFPHRRVDRPHDQQQQLFEAAD